MSHKANFGASHLLQVLSDKHHARCDPKFWFLQTEFTAVLSSPMHPHSLYCVIKTLVFRSCLRGGGSCLKQCSGCRLIRVGWERRPLLLCLWPTWPGMVGRSLRGDMVQRLPKESVPLNLQHKYIVHMPT